MEKKIIIKKIFKKNGKKMIIIIFKNLKNGKKWKKKNFKWKKK